MPDIWHDKCLYVVKPLSCLCFDMIHAQLVSVKLEGNIMADVGDIPPLQPIWPKRPNDKVGPGKPVPDSTEQDNRHKRDKKDNSDDGDEHVDEYA